jgi:hypothetical protein
MTAVQNAKSTLGTGLVTLEALACAFRRDRACAFHGGLVVLLEVQPPFRRQPENDIAVALPLTAQRAQPVDDRPIQEISSSPRSLA